MSVMRKISVGTSLAVVLRLSVGLLAGAGPQGPRDVVVLDSDASIERPPVPSGSIVSTGVGRRRVARISSSSEAWTSSSKVRDADDSSIDEFQEEIRRYGVETRRRRCRQGRESMPSRFALADGVVDPGDYTIAGQRRPAAESDRSCRISRSLRTAAAQLERAGGFAPAVDVRARPEPE